MLTFILVSPIIKFMGLLLLPSTLKEIEMFKKLFLVVVLSASASVSAHPVCKAFSEVASDVMEYRQNDGKEELVLNKVLKESPKDAHKFLTEIVKAAYKFPVFPDQEKKSMASLVFAEHVYTTCVVAHNSY